MWNAIAAIAAAIAAIIAVVTVIVTINELKKTFRSELFSKLLEELGTEDARRDRAIIANITEDNKPSKDSIKETLRLMRTDTNYKNRLEYLNPGMALDRTIPRLDRVGYFILGDNNKLSMELPAWLWDVVENTWKWFPLWQEYRKSEDSKEFKNVYYGRYLENSIFIMIKINVPL